MQPGFIKTLGQNLIGLVFPVVCINCRKEGKYLCQTCSNILKRNEFQICPVCGSPSVFGKTHPSCYGPGVLDGLVSAVPYKEPLARKLVEYCKYKFISGITAELAVIMASEIRNLELQEYFREFLIVPLPLHPAKKRWRGFNQAELIAGCFAKNLQLPLRTDQLYRTTRTKTQAELKDDERKLNVKNAFSAPEILSSRRFLIIDDVSTTRSTLSEACKALKQKGANEVWGLTFAQG